MRYQPPAKHCAVALLVVEVAAEHRRPARAQRELPDLAGRELGDAAVRRRPRRSLASMPGSGLPIEPGRTSMHGRFAIMIPPVSVCHQLSWNGRPSTSLPQHDGLRVERLADRGRDPQRATDRAAARSSGPAFISMRIAVGAVYQTVTRSSLEQLVPALGEELGLVDDARHAERRAARSGRTTSR